MAPVLLIISRGLGDAAFGVVSLLFLFRSAQQKSWAWLHDPFLKGFVVVWVWLFIVSFFAVADSGDSFKRALAWGRFIPLVFAAKYWLLAKAENRKMVLAVLSVAFVYVVVDTLFQKVTGTSFEGQGIHKNIRLTGPFADVVVGTYLAKLGLLVCGFILTVIGNRVSLKRILTGAISVFVLFATILLSGERVAFMSFGLGLVVFVIYLRHYRKTVFVFAGAMFVVLAGLLFAMPRMQARVITQTVHQVSDFKNSHYGMIFDNAFQMIKEYPITGVGLRNYRQVCQQDGYRFYKGVRKSCGLHPHNTYLEWAAEAGLVGLALFVGLMGWIIRGAVNGVRSCDGAGYYIGLGALTALIPFLWPIMSSMSVFTNWNAVLFWFVVAFVFSYTDCSVSKKV